VISVITLWRYCAHVTNGMIDDRHDLNQYRSAIAIRYDKTAVAFLDAIHLATSVVWLC
jgi:transposase